MEKQNARKPWARWLSGALATAMVVTLLPNMPQAILTAKAAQNGGGSITSTIKNVAGTNLAEYFNDVSSTWAYTESSDTFTPADPFAVTKNTTNNDDEEFVFDGWYTEATFENAFDKATLKDVGADHNVTVFGKAHRDKATVTYATEGVAGKPDAPSAATLALTLADANSTGYSLTAVPTKNGYSGSAWTVTSPATGYTVAAGKVKASSAVTDVSDVTVTSTYTLNDYTVKWTLTNEAKSAGVKINGAQADVVQAFTVADFSNIANVTVTGLPDGKAATYSPEVTGIDTAAEFTAAALFTDGTNFNTWTSSGSDTVYTIEVGIGVDPTYHTIQWINAAGDAVLTASDIYGTVPTSFHTGDEDISLDYTSPKSVTDFYKFDGWKEANGTTPYAYTGSDVTWWVEASTWNENKTLRATEAPIEYELVVAPTATVTAVSGLMTKSGNALKKTITCEANGFGGETWAANSVSEFVAGTYNSAKIPDGKKLIIRSENGVTDLSTVTKSYLFDGTTSSSVYARYIDDYYNYADGKYTITIDLEADTSAKDVTYALNGGHVKGNESATANIVDADGWKAGLPYAIKTSAAYTVEKYGYKFVGWSTVDGDEDKIVDSLAAPAKDTTVYAIWEAIDYKVVFNANPPIKSGNTYYAATAKVKNPSKSFTYGGGTDNKIAADDYDDNYSIPWLQFKAWSTENGNEVWSAGAIEQGTILTNLDTMIEAAKATKDGYTINVYEVWQAEKYYVVTFDGNGGTLNGDTRTLEKYDVEHWLTGATPDPQEAENEKQVVGDITLPTSTTTPDIDTFFVATDAIQRSGYTFKGWYADAACTKAAPAKVTDNDSGDVTYYAGWTANVEDDLEYKVIYHNASGAAMDPIDSEVFTYGKSNKTTTDEYTPLELEAFSSTNQTALIKNYYELIGWNYSGKTDDTNKNYGHLVVDTDFKFTTLASAATTEFVDSDPDYYKVNLTPVYRGITYTVKVDTNAPVILDQKTAAGTDSKFEVTGTVVDLGPFVYGADNKAANEITGTPWAKLYTGLGTGADYTDDVLKTDGYYLSELNYLSEGAGTAIAANTKFDLIVANAWGSDERLVKDGDNYVLSIYARWTAKATNTFNVIYNANGGKFDKSGTPKDEYKVSLGAYGETVAANTAKSVTIDNYKDENGDSTAFLTKWQGDAPAKVSREGYTLAGWFLDDGAVSAADGEIYYSTDAQDFTVYAGWTPDYYRFALDGDGDDDEKTRKEDENAVDTTGNIYLWHKYDEQSVSFPKVTKKGYTFGGWSNNGKTYVVGKTYKVKDIVAASTVNAGGTAKINKTDDELTAYTGAIAFTAVWSGNKYSITYNNVKESELVDGNKYFAGYYYAGGNINTALDKDGRDKTYHDDYGTEIVDPLKLGKNDFYRPGYSFEGFFDDEDKKLTAIDFTGENENLVYTASWAENKYYVDYKAAYADPAGTAIEAAGSDTLADPSAYSIEIPEGKQFVGYVVNPANAGETAFSAAALKAGDVYYPAGTSIKKLIDNGILNAADMAVTTGGHLEVNEASKNTNTLVAVFADLYEITFAQKDKDGKVQAVATISAAADYKIPATVSGLKVPSGQALSTWYLVNSSGNVTSTKIAVGKIASELGGWTTDAEAHVKKMTICAEFNDAFDVTVKVDSLTFKKTLVKGSDAWNGLLKSWVENEDIFTLNERNAFFETQYKTWSGVTAAAKGSDGKLTVYLAKNRSMKYIIETELGTEPKTRSITLTAAFDGEPYTIRFANKDGVPVGASDIKTTYGTIVELPDVKENASFKKDGYTPVGWNTQANGKGTSYSFGQKVSNLTSDPVNTKTVILYPVYQGKTYTIVYHSNPNQLATQTATTAGKEQTKKVSFTLDAEAKLPNATFTQKGYQIKGWGTADGSSTVKYTVKTISETGADSLIQSAVKDKSYSDAADIDLYAVWEKTTYKVTTHFLDGRVDVEKTFNIATADFDIDNPTSPNYTFKGWYLDAGLSKAAPLNAAKTKATIKKGTVGNVDLYAKWVGKDITITFHSNVPGETAEKTKTQTLVYGVEGQTLTKNGFSYKGHVFAGWATSKTGETKYANSGLITPTENLNLYAIWAVSSDPFKITLRLDKASKGAGVKDLKADDKSATTDADKYSPKPGEAEGVYVSTYKYGTAEALPTPDMNEHYEFDGWYNAATDKVITSIDAKTIGDVDLYPVFHGEEHTITYEANLPSGVTAKVTSSTLKIGYGDKLGDILTADYKPFVVDGYTLEGWYKEAAATNAANTIVGLNGDTSTLTADVTIYAKWTAIEYKVRIYNASAATFANVNGDFADEVDYNGVQYVDYTYTVADIGSLKNKLTLPVPSSKYSTFAGYYTKLENGKYSGSVGKKNQIASGTKPYATVYAKWDTSFTIQYWYDDAKTTPAAPSQVVKPGKTAKLSNVAKGVTKADNVFMGWINDNGVQYDAGQTLSTTALGNLRKDSTSGETITNVIDLYANWQPIKTTPYTVTLHYGDDGGDWNVAYNYDTDIADVAVQYTYGTGISGKDLKLYQRDPGKYPYLHFSYWATQSGKKVTSIGKKAAGDLDLYAVYKIDKYTVTFDPNVPAAAGKKLKTKKQTIKAQNLVFTNNGGQTIISQNWTNLTKMGWKLEDNGFRFVGWTNNKAAVAEVSGIAAGTHITSTQYDNIISAGSSAARYNKMAEYGIFWGDKDGIRGRDTTLYAVWAPINIHVTYYTMGGSIADPAIKDTYNKSKDSYTQSFEKVAATTTLATPYRLGYTFKGWKGYQYNAKGTFKKVTVKNPFKTYKLNGALQNYTEYEAVWKLNK